ncbi:class I SAM-dependent methyltransferase [Candidatus Margulisiibacteriota bacterium]
MIIEAERHNYLDNENDFWTVNKNTVLLGLIKDKKNVLEIGCGKATFLRELAKKGIQCEGIDFSKNCLAAAKEICRGYNVNLFYGDFMEYHFDKKYDCIVLSGVIEHIADDKLCLLKVKDLLVAGGQIVLLTSAHPFLYSCFDRVVNHYRRYSKRQLLKLLRSAGLSLKSIRYWDMLAFPYLLLVRLFERILLNEAELNKMSQNRIFMWWFRHFENRLSFPLGVNLIAVAKK